jgi:hypothetical protein
MSGAAENSDMTPDTIFPGAEMLLNHRLGQIEAILKPCRK